MVPALNFSGFRRIKPILPAILCGLLIHINGWGQNFRTICHDDRSVLSGPVISNLTYDTITHTSVTLHWNTDLPDTLRSKFGIQKCNNTARILNVGGVRMEVYFTPTDSITDTLVSLITNKSVKSIYFCMLKFISLPNIEEVLHQRYLNRIQVSGVFDSACSIRHGSSFPRMKGENVPNAWQPPADVFIDTIPGLLHHKYSVINADTTAGEKITTTGSFNWELPAQQNGDENMLVIYNPAINNFYFQEFMARYRESGGALLGSGMGTEPPGDSDLISALQCFPNP